MVRSRERVEGEREEMILSSRSYSGGGGGGSGSCSNNVRTEPDKRDKSDGTVESVLGDYVFSYSVWIGYLPLIVAADPSTLSSSRLDGGNVSASPPAAPAATYRSRIHILTSRGGRSRIG